MKQPNVRFWEFINNGWVKLTLKPDQSLHHHTYKPDDEGYSFTNCEYRYEEGAVFRDWESGGRDCDGPISTAGCDVCPAARLAAIEAYVSYEGSTEHLFNGKHIHRPDWQKYRQTRVHDAYAQSMNY